MAIKVKRQEMQVEQELAEKLKELGLEIEFPIEHENDINENVLLILLF